MLIIISYLSAALAGMILLSLPAASTSDPISPLDALFTSTSAICVTGLIVVDTGSQFTLFGKSVILILIQLGGLGVMTFSVFLFLFLGRGLGTKQRWIIIESFTPTPIREIGSLIRSIFVFTFVIEGIGTFLLFLFWRSELPAAEAVFTSLFHAISAFCNAGFSFFESSFIAYRGSVLLNATIVALIVVGGVGFPVIYEILGRMRRQGAGVRRRLSLHSRMVLWTTAALIAAGGLLILLLESGHQFPALPWNERILAALFQSITARTAGFNTLDIPSLGETTLFVLIMLMFIGASPGSCGGGIKTTSLAVMVAIFRSKIRGRDTVDVFHRTLPDETVSRALAIFIMGVLTVVVGLVLLLVTQMNTAQSGSAFFLAHLFEVVSAFATVGLSMGITSTLTGAGKLVVVVLMLLGRVGLLTVAYVVTRRARGSLFRYSEEKVMIG
jgi:trk system potassium uptake protein TrkH